MYLPFYIMEDVISLWLQIQLNTTSDQDVTLSDFLFFESEMQIK